MDKKSLYRRIPKVDILMNSPKINCFSEHVDREIIIAVIRKNLDTLRGLIDEGVKETVIHQRIESITHKIERDLINMTTGYLKEVINGTGVIIHTNLGRSVLSKEIFEEVKNTLIHYTNLEYDLSIGARGSRYDLVEELICALTGAESALVVNNNAAAVILTLKVFSSEYETIVSRGELVEIGGSFRIPEVMKLSGARLIEVGTTNRTYLKDYQEAVSEQTKVLMKVHTSNYNILGFTESAKAEELVDLARKENLMVIEDLGSGVLIDLTEYNFDYEPTVRDSIQKGIDLVTFSGDKLLGGPQCGIIVGKKKYIDQLKKNQLTRALRVDKFTLAALEAVFRRYLNSKTVAENIPVLKMMTTSSDEIKEKALRLKHLIQSLDVKSTTEIVPSVSKFGGGSMPQSIIQSFAIAIKPFQITASEMEERLRKNNPPIVTRVSNEEILIDLRTVFEEQYEAIAKAILKIERGDR
jgi:L-seryl-tRNA(Ser) seleniumtransferase